MAETVIRVGIPQPGGQLVGAARRRRLPVLFSANAFAKVYPAAHERAGYFKSFRLPDPAQFDGLDAALDSAGFVAAARYGDYRWSVDQHLDLVASHSWAWWSSLDMCCEPEIAQDRPLRLLRMAATARLLGECRRGAAARGLPMPMPILQGWTPQEYVTCAGWLPLVEWPDLVGVGSVCRRPVHGPNGLLAVLDAVDAVLPRHVGLHLFGVKSAALEVIAGHPRIVSVDSMAWDMAARAACRTGRTARYRIGHMQAWASAQNRVARRAAGAGRTLVGLAQDVSCASDRRGLVDLALEGLAQCHAELVMSGDMEYRDAVWQCVFDGATVTALLNAHGMRFSGALSEDLEEVMAGLGEAVGELCEGAAL